MEDVASSLETLQSALAEVVATVLGENKTASSNDRDLVGVIAAAGGISRLAEALLIEGAAEVAHRSDAPAHSERMTARLGCHNVAELLQRVTRMSAHSASDVVAAGRAVHRAIAPSSGELLPAEFPAMRKALAAGSVGVDGLLAVARPLAGVLGAAGRSAHLAADEELAAAAQGEGVDAAPPVCADELRSLATVWAMYLDQDGAEPRESRAIRKRGATLGVCRDGLVPLRGNLLPEVAGQLQLVFDSILNPKAGRYSATPGPRFVTGDDDVPSEKQADLRTQAQKQHDALATALAKVAGSGGLPTLGGSAPTLVVSVQAEDYESGRGYAHIEGCDEPVSLSVAQHVACCGDIQRVVFDKGGRIVSIDTTDRVFNVHQRRAIGVRDGGCIIPGCGVRAEWCEIHHVVESARGGPTHTSNGVALCWWHHRTIDSSGWEVRMRGGVPEVLGPFWWDAAVKWRPVTKSPTRMRERFVRRT